MADLAIPFQILAGWLLADLLSGFLHWAEDNHGSEDWPIIGPHVIAPNRLHHRDPVAFIRDGNPLTRNSTNAIISIVLGGALSLWLGPSVVLLVATLGGCVANEVHRYAHQPLAGPFWVRLLQRTGLLQSLHHHGVHHRSPHDRAYCILTNWLNPVLDRIGIWTRLDAAISFAKRPH